MKEQHCLKGIRETTFQTNKTTAEIFSFGQYLFLDPTVD